jgi:hypothetical protein
MRALLVAIKPLLVPELVEVPPLLELLGGLCNGTIARLRTSSRSAPTPGHTCCSFHSLDTITPFTCEYVMFCRCFQDAVSVGTEEKLVGERPWSVTCCSYGERQLVGRLQTVRAEPHDFLACLPTPRPWCLVCARPPRACQRWARQSSGIWCSPSRLHSAIRSRASPPWATAQSRTAGAHAS